MQNITVYTAKKENGTVSFPSDWVSDLSSSAVAQAIRVYEDRRHPGLARVKNRGEVALTTKKMYRQKHTGNARHGAASAPIFVGGGVTHGPKGLKRKLVLTDSIKRGTLKTVFGMKLKLKQIGAVDVSTISKTKDAQDAINLTKANKVLVVLTKDSWEKAKAFRNISGAVVSLVDNINTLEVLKSHFVLFDSSLFKASKETTVKAKAKTQKTK